MATRRHRAAATREWSKRRLIEAIRSRFIQGGPLRARGRRDRTLVWAAKSYFGTWDNAIVAAGIVREETVG